MELANAPDEWLMSRYEQLSDAKVFAKGTERYEDICKDLTKTAFEIIYRVSRETGVSITKLLYEDEGDQWMKR